MMHAEVTFHLCSVSNLSPLLCKQLFTFALQVASVNSLDHKARLEWSRVFGISLVPYWGEQMLVMSPHMGRNRGSVRTVS